MQNCQITSIDRKSFNKMQKLEIINLRLNKFDNLEAKTFEHFKFLKRLYLDHCKITAIPNGLFKGLNQLEILDLSFNPIKHLSSTFEDLSSLKELFLNNCEILAISICTVMNKLERLCLSNNPIKCLSSKTFVGMKSLKILELSNLAENAVFENDLLSPLQNLQELHLANNNGIGELLKSDPFKHMRSLTILDIRFCNITK